MILRFDTLVRPKFSVTSRYAYYLGLKFETLVSVKDKVTQ